MNKNHKNAFVKFTKIRGVQDLHLGVGHQRLCVFIMYIMSMKRNVPYMARVKGPLKSPGSSRVLDALSCYQGLIFKHSDMIIFFFFFFFSFLGFFSSSFFFFFFFFLCSQSKCRGGMCLLHPPPP